MSSSTAAEANPIRGNDFRNFGNDGSIGMVAWTKPARAFHPRRWCGFE